MNNNNINSRIILLLHTSGSAIQKLVPMAVSSTNLKQAKHTCSLSLSLNVCVNFNSFACSIHLSTFTSKTDVFRSGPSFALFASLICSCSFFMQMLFHEAFSFYSTMSTKWMIAWPKIYLFQIIMLQSANLFGFLLSINCNHISARIVTSTHSWRAFFLFEHLQLYMKRVRKSVFCCLLYFCHTSNYSNNRMQSQCVCVLI